MLHAVDEDAQQKIRGLWSELAKEWRCAAVYAKKTQEFRDNKSFSTGSLEPTVKKKTVNLTKFTRVQTDSNVNIYQ